MRVSDDRYNRDRQRFDLALRMLRHGARIKSICAWTGLTEDRLRKLWRTYRPVRGRRKFQRQRAKVPHHASGFLRSSALGFEASSLASIFYLLGLIPADGRPDRSLVENLSLKRLVTFCEAYEIYLTLYPPARLSFEHAWFLLTRTRGSRWDQAECLRPLRKAVSGGAGAHVVDELRLWQPASRPATTPHLLAQRAGQGCRPGRRA